MLKVKKSDVIRYDEKGITIEYKGEEWTIPYGKFVTKKDIDSASPDTYIYLAKYGKWVVARVGERKNHTENGNAPKSHRNAPTLQDDLEQIQNMLMDLKRRVEALEEHVNAIEVRIKEW